MKYEIRVYAYNHYRKQYLNFPSSDNFEAQFFFWKQLNNALTNENERASNTEILRLITLEIRRIEC